MKKFLSNKRGASTVEFALTVAFYFFLVCLILEFCRVAITTAYWDLAITQSIKIAKNQQVNGGNYADAFEKALKEQAILKDDSPIGYLATIGKKSTSGKPYEITVKYVNCDRNKSKSCIQGLLDGNYKKLLDKNNKPILDNNGKEIDDPNGTLSALAHYRLTYQYEFMIDLPFMPKSIVNNALTREFVAVQEYNRSQFQFNRGNSINGVVTPP